MMETESYEHVVSNFRLQMVFPNLVKELLLSRKVKGMDKRWRRVWSMLPLSLFWCIWRESNKKIFNEEELNNHMLKEIFIRSLIEWSRALLGKECASLLDFIDILNCG